MKNTKEAVLHTARLEFAEHGLAGARVDRIAKLAGVNKAMIYYHFHSKEELYEAVIDSHFSQIGSFLETGSSGDEDPEAFLLRLSEFLHSVMAVSNENGLTPVFLRELANGGERIKTALTRIIAEKGLQKKLKGIIDSGVHHGRFQSVDSRHAIISFIGMNMFYLLMAPAVNSVWEITNDKKFRRERPQQVVNLFLHGLKVR